MASKRIYQIAKEFGHDEKEIIEFLTGQGIKVANRLSAVSDDTYNLLKAKYTASPEPVVEPESEPIVEPAPEPVAEQSAAPTEEASAPAKKKKKKNKPAAPDAAQSGEQTGEEVTVKPADFQASAARMQAICRSALEAGNEFIENYYPVSKKQRKANRPYLAHFTDTWSLLNNIAFEYPDESPARYWNAVSKLVTRAFQLINAYGLSHRNILGELRDLMVPVGTKYEPREIFTDEENNHFEAQQKFIFRTFGHGMGTVNDNLYELKMHAEHMRTSYEDMNFVEFVTNPADVMRSKDRVPFNELVDTITFSISGIARRVDFYCENKEIVTSVLKNFFEWIDGYAKLKEQSADADKLAKYLELEQKFFNLVEFMSFDNLVFLRKNKPAPFNTLLDILNDYRDNLDDPDAERNFKYKVRGVTNVIYKPKEFIFIYRFGDLELKKDYRPPQEVADAEAATAEAATAETATAETATAEVVAEKENPADVADEA